MSTLSTDTDSASACRELVHAVVETLAQGEMLLAGISDGDYTRTVPVAFHASIGGHYRHCLDHFRSLLNAAEAGHLNYDHRERGTLVETDRQTALAATRELGNRYEALDPALLARPLVVTCQTSYAASGPQCSPSTMGREVMYAVAHAVHHYALIGIMGGVMGLALPAAFGVAPSTLKYQRESAAATPPSAVSISGRGNTNRA